MLIPLLVVAAFACLLVDPRDPRQVLVAEGVRPHPGPERGIVKQAVEDIEEAMQQRKRREDREAGREGDVEPESCEIQKAKKLRYHLPPQEACGSNASVNQFKDEGKGKLLRDTGGSQGEGTGKSKNKETREEPQPPRAPKFPKRTPEKPPQPQDKSPLKTF